MLSIILAWSGRDLIEMAVTGVLIVAVMGIWAAIPFLAEHFVDDRLDKPSE